MKQVNMLVYGDVNLNVMDGSSVWLAEFLTILATDPRIELDFLSKKLSTGGPLNSQLKNVTRINRIDKPDLQPMEREQVIEAIHELDNKNHYDRIFVRGDIALGKELVKFLSGRLIFYTLEPFQKLGQLTKVEKEEISEILNRTAFSVVQSNRMWISYSEEFCVPKDKFYILPPLIPKKLENPSFRNINNTLCYTGKFSEDWGTLDLIDTFEKLREEIPYAKLNIAGDKFNRDLQGKDKEIKKYFSSEKKINWVGAVSRDNSIRLSRYSDIGFALRSSVIDNDDSQELSTKLFEYMSAGKPVILRPTLIHKELLGENYPLFANDSSEAAVKCSQAMRDVALYRESARQCYKAYEKFSKENNPKGIVERILAYKKTTIIFAGDDLKFLQDTIASYRRDARFNVLIDNWGGSEKNNGKARQSMLKEADIIFCEWGLASAQWYSLNKLEGQRLIVRVHLQENRRRQFLDKADKDKIDKFIFIAPYRYEEFVEMHNLPRDKAKMIFNTVDVDAFNKIKSRNARWTVGFVGIVPWRKRFDKALDFFDRLWRKDNRYILRVKGKLPEDYPWMKVPPRDKELEMYNRLFDRIERAPWKDNVFFDGHGNDMADWYQEVGYLISTSDYEGSHQAVAEAMASGATPLILPWEGASTVYPKDYIFQSIGSMADFVTKNLPNNNNVAYASKHFSSKYIVEKIRKECDPLLEGGPEPGKEQIEFMEKLSAIQSGDQFKVTEFSVPRQGFILELFINAVCSEKDKSRYRKSAVVLLSFYDNQGRELMNVPGLGVSKAFNKLFRYIDASDLNLNGNPRELLKLRLPEKVTLVKVSVAGLSIPENEFIDIKIKGHCYDENALIDQRHEELMLQTLPSPKVHDSKIKRLTKDLTVACILDELTTECLSHEVNILKLKRETWQSQMQEQKADFLLVESCWRGNDGNWGALNLKNNGSKKLSGLLNYCIKNNIPTVFWNKEDPPHYETFAPVAVMFDFVFTTDINVISRYKKDFGITAHSLSFAAQPKIHNPLLNISRKDKAVFAGSYYSEREARCNDFHDIVADLDAVGVGYDIYDRNHMSGIERFQYPDRYAANIIGKLPPEELWKVNNGYKYQINLNSVTDSSTMFARRVYESLASGTPVISNASKGVSDLFGDLVIMNDASGSIADKVRELEKSREKYNSLAKSGVRRVMREHTYSHRIKEICELIGIDVALDQPEITAIATANNSSDVDKAKSIFWDQTYPNKKLFISLEKFTDAHVFLNQSDRQISYSMALGRDFYDSDESFYLSDRVVRFELSEKINSEYLEDAMYWGGSDD